eukprot:TRINITY_DN10560_c0_g1_i1.p1 TRINITY_DN10560_c0_g1~~TRINITY_DN10560_c0_g1_i1.p1  ORF type:complete len:194 (+),score=33.46 TRINITY_DN10560_c0_g1_i1:52-633(+)
MHSQSQLSSHVEFMAEDEMISILPKTDMDALNFATGLIGPFISSLPVSVPLWLAVYLKKRGLCSFVVPDWLRVEKVKEWHEYERNEGAFAQLPEYHTIVIANVLLNEGSDDIHNAGINPEELRSALHDLWDNRRSKINRGIQKISAATQVVSVDLNNLTSSEINTYRGFILETLNSVHQLNRAVESSGADTYK